MEPRLLCMTEDTGGRRDSLPGLSDNGRRFLVMSRFRGLRGVATWEGRISTLLNGSVLLSDLVPAQHIANPTLPPPSAFPHITGMRVLGHLTSGLESERTGWGVSPRCAFCSVSTGGVSGQSSSGPRQPQPPGSPNPTLSPRPTAGDGVACGSAQSLGLWVCPS